MKLSKMSTAKENDHLWLTYWLVVVDSLADDGLFGAGLLGFKGCPDRNGEVEIGYGIDPDYQNKGYTTEAVRAMIAWAFQDPQCKSVIAPNTQRTNLASNRVLAKVGMRIYRETADALFWRIDRKDPLEYA
jgi:RimJ/RimL family protein N-acetyltransferase